MRSAGFLYFAKGIDCGLRKQSSAYEKRSIQSQKIPYTVPRFQGAKAQLRLRRTRALKTSLRFFNSLIPPQRSAQPVEIHKRVLSKCIRIVIVAFGSAPILAYRHFAIRHVRAAALIPAWGFLLLARRSSVRAALTAHRAVIHSCPSSAKPNPQTPSSPRASLKLLS